MTTRAKTIHIPHCGDKVRFGGETHVVMEVTFGTEYDHLGLLALSKVASRTMTIVMAPCGKDADWQRAKEE